MYVKFHIKGDRTVVAICDKDLIGKTLEDKKQCIEITERFYKGEKKTEKEVAVILQEATNINIIGKKSIALAIKQGVLDKEAVRKIKRIPHAQIYEGN
ncbi:MAG: DUF424 family protein [Nanoarchaeota archaeon]|nr:DUF424 family protein [Nanoarchaeota archaeon]MBU1445120.1 DUF424 family protein [Nanoarchaeota archaeon]MBU2420094.1 DUF424 family protein [Nanoarchaeota archaeon]MBU2475547.1 DUF424 family protein [Nanoarchaeota archaeon]